LLALNRLANVKVGVVVLCLNVTHAALHTVL
jgi:hypothetical protein